LSAGREEQVEECIPLLIPLVVLHGKIQKYLVAEVGPQVGPHTAPVVALVRIDTACGAGRVHYGRNLKKTGYIFLIKTPRRLLVVAIATNKRNCGGLRMWQQPESF